MIVIISYGLFVDLFLLLPCAFLISEIEWKSWFVFNGCVSLLINILMEGITPLHFMGSGSLDLTHHNGLTPLVLGALMKKSY